MAETETLIKNSMILSKVAKMSSADSTDVLTTAMNSFNLTANDTISIIDKLTSVDLVSASSAEFSVNAGSGQKLTLFRAKNATIRKHEEK